MPAALSSLAPAPAKPPYSSARACALMQPFATATMQLFGVNLALRWRLHTGVASGTAAAHRRRATHSSIYSDCPVCIGPTRRYV